MRLGSRRGHLTDWLTQRWVCATGRRVDLRDDPWLAGPIAQTDGIVPGFFQSLAEREGLALLEPGEHAGILPSFACLKGPSFDPSAVHPGVVHFYESTGSYELDAWAEWCGAFRSFGRLLAVLFSRRLQQLNVPLTGLDTARGLTNDVLHLAHPSTGAVRYIAWRRLLRGSGDVLYAGFYSACTLPGRKDPCVKVVFPLPNGNAIVIMRTEVRPDGSFVVTSAGNGFGDPGFYFTVHAPSGAVVARYVKSLRESIHVFPDERGALRADHELTFLGARFLRLHYRMRRLPSGEPGRAG